MTNILVLREYLKGIYGKYEIYITPVEKFLLSFITLMLINRKLGYMSKLNGISVILIAGLLCSFLPMNFMILIAAAFILLHLYAFSMECAIVVLALFLVMFTVFSVFIQRYGDGAPYTDLLFAEHSFCNAPGGRADQYPGFGNIRSLWRGGVQYPCVYFGQCGGAEFYGC